MVQANGEVLRQRQRARSREGIADLRGYLRAIDEHVNAEAYALLRQLDTVATTLAGEQQRVDVLEQENRELGDRLRKLLASHDASLDAFARVLVAVAQSEAGGRLVHAAWRDGRRRQLRPVAPERQLWETLNPADCDLAIAICGAVARGLVATLKAGARTLATGKADA